MAGCLCVCIYVQDSSARGNKEENVYLSKGGDDQVIPHMVQNDITDPVSKDSYEKQNSQRLTSSML